MYEMMKSKTTEPIFLLQVSRSTRDPLGGQHSLNYPPSFLFRYLERLVRSVVVTTYTIHLSIVDFKRDLLAQLR